MEVTARLAEFIVETKFESFPAEVIEKSKEAFLDWLGVTLAGIETEAGKIIVEFVREQGGNEQATIVGTKMKTSSGNAALAMGTLSHALDFDDVHFRMLGHPSVTLLPVVFALGEQHKASGRQVIEAFAIGFEVESLVGAVTSEKIFHKGWHATSTVGPLGAAAVGAKLLGLDARQTRQALGIAASHAGGMGANFGSMTKPFHAGNAARGGLVAALLAKGGFTASENVLEASHGFADLFCGEQGQRIEELPALIGQGWGLVSPGRVVKRYPSCALTHSGIDSVMAICAEQGLDGQDIEAIECVVERDVPNILVHVKPQTGLQGKFSLQYCLAVAAVDGEPGLRHFEDDTVRREDLQAMTAKVKVVPILEGMVNESKVTVRAKGQTYAREAKFAKGSPELPLTYTETVAKFEACTKGILTEAQMADVEGKIRQLEDLCDMGQLVRACDPTH